MLLNYNVFVSGGYFASDINNDNFYLEFKYLCDEFKGLAVVLKQLESNGLTVDGKKVYFKFEDNDFLSYLRYCINFIKVSSINDFAYFRDYFEYWCEGSLTYKDEFYSGFHAIKIDNYSEFLKFYAVIYYFAELYLEL